MISSRHGFSLLALVLLLGVLGGCATVYRHFEFPQPAGPYAVGSKAVMVTNADRPEIYAPSPGQPRSFMIQLWYPADPALVQGLPALSYGPEIEAVLVSLGGALGKGFSYLHAVPTRTYADLPLARAQRPFPVLVFSPGNLSTRFQSLDQVAALVSQGYVVVGVDHPYTSTVVNFPDGRQLKVTDRSTSAYAESEYTVEKQLAVRVGDVASALDYLEGLNADPQSPFAGRLDLARVGAFGHSLGGATVLQLAAEDPRIKAVFSEEGGVWGSVVHTGVKVPFWYVQAGKTLASTSYSASGIKADKASTKNDAAFASFKQEFAANLTGVLRLSGPEEAYFVVKGFSHFSFSDAPLYSDLLAGDLPWRRSLALNNDMLSAFFGHYLNGQPLDLPRLLAKYPEIQTAPGPALQAP